MCRKGIFVLLNVFSVFIINGVSEHCFRGRIPEGNLGQCDGVISSVDTIEECCEAGGSGWAAEQNGNNCEPACPVKFCFRNRKARSSRLGSCTGLIGKKTKEDCCRQGGEGWTKSKQGQRCLDTCHGVTDESPAKFCFSSRQQNSESCRPSTFLRKMTKLECCQNGGKGWSTSRDGVECQSACETGPLEVIHGGWSDWSEWDTCSETCGDGIQRRYRTCDNPAPKNGGADCDGEQVEEAVCQDRRCPIDGKWGQWQPYGECSATCTYLEDKVYRQQKRECNNPPPQFGGLSCVGPSIRNTACTDLPQCPIDGGWSEYSEWSDCSQTCENGTQVRTRACDNPTPQYGGRQCEGEDTDKQVCQNSRVCPTHGGWSEWGRWTPCTARRCGVEGSTFRYRSCTKPTPKNRGLFCIGRAVDQRACTRSCEDLGSGSGSGSGSGDFFLFNWNKEDTGDKNNAFSYSVGEFLADIEDLQPSILDAENEALQLDPIVVESESFSFDYSLEEQFLEYSNVEKNENDQHRPSRQRKLPTTNRGSDSYSFDDI